MLPLQDAFSHEFARSDCAHAPIIAPEFPAALPRARLSDLVIEPEDRSLSEVCVSNCVALLWRQTSRLAHAMRGRPKISLQL
jgi:hypothetical protein